MDTSMILYLFFGGALLILSIFCILLHQKLHRFMRGKNGTSLEGTLQTLLSTATAHEKEIATLHHTISNVDKRVATSIRGVAVKRFNPFAQHGGGNQSFAIAFVNEHGDGVVLSSLYARDRVSIFAKPVVKGTSSYELTAEEAAVLTEAKQ